MTLDKQGNFSQQPSELPDVPSPSMTPDQIRAKWQTPLDELKTTMNNAFDKLNATTKSASGADNIGATDWDGITASTVGALLSWLKANKTDLTGNHEGTWQGFNPSQVDQTIRDQVNTNTSQLADITQNVHNQSGATYGEQLQNLINLSTLLKGRIFLPFGDVTLNDITIPAGKMFEFVGGGWSYDSGYGTKILTDSGHSSFILSDGANGNTFRDLYFHGGGNGKAIDGTYGNKTRVENCLIENFDTGLYSRQGLWVIKDSFIRNNVSYGIDINSDSWVIDTELSVNGIGARVVAGGVRFVNNFVNTNTSHGIVLDGTAVPGSTVGWNLISGGYIGENGGENIYFKGSAARNTRYNQICDTFIQQVSTTIGHGIKFENTDHCTISDIIFLGGSDGNAKDTGFVELNSSHNSKLNNLKAYNSSGMPINIIASNDTQIDSFDSVNHGTSTNSIYGVNIDANSYKTRINGISLLDVRSPGYSKGINNLGVSTSIVDYRISTPVGSPDSLGSASCLMFTVNNKFTLLNEDNIGYNVAITQGATNQQITLPYWYGDANFGVVITPSWNTSYWVTAKDNGHFTVNFGTTAPAGGKIDWKVFR